MMIRMIQWLWFLLDNDDDYDDLLMMGSSAESQLATRRSICPTRPLPKTQCKSTQDEATLFDSNQNEISKQCANTPRIENITITAHLTIGKSLQLCKRSTPNYQNHSQEDHPDHCQKKHLFFAGWLRSFTKFSIVLVAQDQLLRIVQVICKNKHHFFAECCPQRMSLIIFCKANTVVFAREHLLRMSTEQHNLQKQISSTFAKGWLQLRWSRSFAKK